MGFFTPPDVSTKYKLEELRVKVDIWDNLIINGYLYMRVVWKVFWGTIWHTIAYPLPVMTLTEDQVEWLTK